MKRAQLEHILRAAGAITGAEQIVVIGSQAIHGASKVPPDDVLDSVEADVFTFRSREDAELIGGMIGELSLFHQTFGYHVHGVGEETATLPNGWRDRLVPLRTVGAAGRWCGAGWRPGPWLTRRGSAACVVTSSSTCSSPRSTP